MEVSSLPFPNIPPSHQMRQMNRWSRRILTFVLAFTLLVIASSVVTIYATGNAVGLGGLLSERMLGRAGSPDSSMLLGRNGAGTTLSILGFAPIVSTRPATDFTGQGVTATATLHGLVSNMKGQPSATAYFKWGYSVANLANTSTTTTITGTGDVAITVTVDANQTVYYQFYTDADGTSFGSIASVVLPSGAGNVMLQTILRVLLAATIIIGVVVIGRGNFRVMLFAVVIGLVAFAVVDVMLISIL